ncbi:MAG: S8 family serine peptidase, partial [Oscillospiraceae bacterium]|nr:S8 family serine peptidase [Oscillospiraceae bacterium]
MKSRLLYRIFAFLLILCMTAQMLPGVSAMPADAGTEELAFRQEDAVEAATPDKYALASDVAEDEAPYGADELVRVSIVLQGASTIRAGFEASSVSTDSAALRYRQSLRTAHDTVISSIEAATAEELDVVWDLTLAANLLSANVRYGQIEAIENLRGVEKVVIERRYEPAVASVEAVDPNMATSGDQIGSTVAYDTGYFGTGTRIAVIDTGIDTDHQSFDAGALEYAIGLRAEEQDTAAEAYREGLDLLDAEEISGVLDQLNIRYVRAEQLYLNSKIPFAYNYVDMDYDVTHDNDSVGEHGSHVAGIAAANAFIPAAEGAYENALDSVHTQGVAPDAQIIAMKVFGKTGGAYDSDYMAAIEDAIVLGADVINLSLGSPNPGFSSAESEYQSILDELEHSGVTVVIAAGNSYNWATFAGDRSGYLYSEDVSLDTLGAPASFTNSLSVASVDNSGFTGYYFAVGDRKLSYKEDSEQYSNASLTTLAGDWEYILIDGIGTEEEFAALSDVLSGRIAVCSRGTISFVSKAENAVKYGAVATIIYNNEPGTINMDLTDYTQEAPVISITQAQGTYMREAAEAVTTAAGEVLYYRGALYISAGMDSASHGLEYDTMSDFSSWGVPGSLELKPELTAPGGNIYSVNGLPSGGTAYENMSGTSMAAPQVAGMTALLTEHLETLGLAGDTVSMRHLTQSLLMSTAVPIVEESSGNPWSVLSQGAGLANIGHAISANSYLLMDEAANAGASDGKVKVELGDDPDRNGSYSYGFTLTNFSDQTLYYTLAADLYTQGLLTGADGSTYLDTRMTALSAAVTWTVGGETFVPRAAVECDLDGDGDTDSDDAQMILDYCVGSRTELNEALADLDQDGQVSTYDAHILLAEMETAAFAVAPGSSVHIVADLTLSAQTKAVLNANYPNGAYLEGYAWVRPVTTAEGEIPDATHSIPILGFYGNWTDATMFDHAAYTDGIYNTQGRTPYVGTWRNALTLRYAGDSTVYYQIGNPYWIEEDYPEERLAVSSSSVLYRYHFGLIRNASAVSSLITNEAGEILYLGPVSNRVNGAYYSVNSGAWMNSTAAVSTNQRVAGLAVEEGEQIHVGLVAVPEYYETEGHLTAEALRELIETDALGEGAYLMTTMTVDNTAPQVTRICKDLMTGALLVRLSDNQYIANVEVRNRSGSDTYAALLPEQTEAGQTVDVELEIPEGVTGELVVIVSDYANNQSVYTVQYENASQNFSGKMIAFTAANVRGSGKRWLEIDPEALYYTDENNYGGTKDFAFTDLSVIAAEYVKGYVYMAADDGYLYAAPLTALDEVLRVGKFADHTETIRDMAYSYADGKLYALGATEGTTSKTIKNVIWSIDLVSGELTREFTVSIVNPRSTSKNYRRLINMTIDDEGNFYAVSFATENYNFFYTWNIEDVVDGAITDLYAVDHTREGAIGHASQLYGGAMAWDHDEDVLYWLNNSTNNGKGAESQYLLKVDLETGKSSPVTERSVMFNTTTGFFIVPSGTDGKIGTTDQAQSVELSSDSLSLPEGTVCRLTAAVYPWTLTDRALHWASSDEAVVTVEDGLLRAVGVGEAVVTVTTNAAPGCQATCTVTVTPHRSVNFSGLVNTGDTARWADVDSAAPENWSAADVAAGNYHGGVLLDNMLYVHDGSDLYAVDPDTFETVLLGQLSASWRFANGAAAPTTADGKFGCIIAPCMGGMYLEMLYPETGRLSYFDATSIFAKDPLAAITLVDYSEEDFELEDWGNMIFETYKNCPKYRFYALTESGALWNISILGYGEEGHYSISFEELTDTGLDLTGVSEADGSRCASALYDQESGQLLLALQDRLYAIDPETGLFAELGSFGAETAVTALYQYERVTELTVRLRRSSAVLFEGETLELTARVLPATYSGGVVWSSSDPAVATVDENGVVTALSDGVAEIRASSVDVSGDGLPAVASCTVTVNGLANLSTTVKAQATVEDGRSLWVTIDTADAPAFTLDAVAENRLTGGGAHDGKIYGSDSEFIITSYYYEVDPGADYAEARGKSVSVSNAILDATTAPAMEVATVDAAGEPITVSAFGGAAYLSYGKSFTILTDYAAGSRCATSSLGSSSDFAAIAYVGAEWDEEEHPVEKFLALSASGKLYTLNVTAVYYPDYGGYWRYGLTKTEYADLGHSFSGVTALTMTYVNDGTNEGLVIGENQKEQVLLWYVDLQAEVPDCRKIDDLPGVTAISCLYTDAAPSAAPASYLIRRGTDSANSSLLSFGTEALAETGMTMAGEEASRNVEQVPSCGRVTLNLTEKKAVTNGLFRVSYDPEVLTFTGLSSLLSNYAVYEAVPGTILFDFAAETPVAAETVLAQLAFACEDDEVRTEIRLTTLERNADLGLEETVLVNVTQENGGHSYQLTESLAPTCTEAGYEVWICAACGDSYRVELEASGHSAERVNAKAAACTEEGYTGDLICTVCGEVVEQGEIIPANCPSAAFKDIDTDQWYHAFVDYVVAKGLMQGVSETVFDPNGNLTRAMMVTVLYRAAGAPEVENASRFTDVAADQWYSDAVAWAAESGIVNGISETEFAPNQNITREQAAAILYRYVTEYLEVEVETGAALSYTDADQISDYAREAVAWATAEGFFQGFPDGSIQPKGTLTRAQMAKLL